MDGSSDTGVEKVNPVTVRMFDTTHNIVSIWFLDMCMCSYPLLGEFLPSSKHDISWANCVGLSIDNTSVHLGFRDSMKTQIVLNNPAVYVMRYSCHIVHNTAIKAGVAFEQLSYAYKTVSSFLD